MTSGKWKPADESSMNSTTTATQLQTMSIPQQYQVPSLNTPLKLPFDEANFAQPLLCRGICFSAANAWYSKIHFAEDDQCSNLFATAEETKRLLMPELLHIWATASFGVFGKISLADASLAVELRMSGWPKDENGTRMIDLYPTIWLKTADKVVKAKSPWKEIAAVVKRLRLNSPQNAKIFVEGGGRLSDDNVTVSKEHLTLDQGITFPSGEALYFHIPVNLQRSSACGLICLITIMKDEAVLEQNICRIGGLINYMLPKQAVTSGHVMTKYFLKSFARDASSADLTDDSAVGMEDSDESECELVQNYKSDHDPEQSLGYIDVAGSTNWRSVTPLDTINFIIQLSKDTAQTSVWKINTSRPIPTDFALLHDIAFLTHQNFYIDPPEQGAPSDTSTRGKKHVSGYHKDESLGAKEVLILVNQELESLVGSLQTAKIPLIVGSATLSTRKLRLQGPLAPGTSGSWVVDRVSGALCGSIIMVYDDEPYALMITAQALLSDIKTYSSRTDDKTIFPKVSESMRDEVQKQRATAWKSAEVANPGSAAIQAETNAWTSDYPVRGKNIETRSRPNYLPFSRNKKFTGREGVINELQRLLFTDSHGRRAALFGLGGVGKTQIALQLAHLLKNSSQSHQHYSIVWMPAFCLASFEHACTEMIKAFNIEHIANKDPKETFRDFLNSEKAGKWFLIIDNVDDMETFYGTSQGADGIAEFIPDCKQGYVLFTTQSRGIAFRVAHTNILEVPRMGMVDARALLHNSLIQTSKIQDTAMADRLLRELAKLPLAITQASAYMNINEISIKKYLQLLQGTDRYMIEQLSLGIYGTTDYDTCQGAVITTWIVSFEQIRASHKSAATLLSAVACFEPKAIPLALLPRFESEQSMTNAIGTLCRYSFFSRREDADIFDMHNLVHMAAKTWNRINGREIRIQMSAFARVFKAFSADTWENHEVRRQHLPHALRLLISLDSNRSKKAGCLGRWVGRWLTEDGKTTQATALLEHLVAVEKMLPVDHPERLASQQELAGVYSANEQIEDVIQLLERVVAFQTTLADDHPDRLTSQHELARAYRTNGQTEDAIRLLEHVVTVDTTLAEDHPDRLASQHELAIAKRANGQIEDAIQLLKHVVTIQKVLPKDHPDRMVSERALARCLQDLYSQGTEEGGRESVYAA